MATLHPPHLSPRVSAVAETVREAFWVIALGAIGCYAFFVALGAFSPGDVVASRSPSACCSCSGSSTPGRAATARTRAATRG
jgi:hypothetical protein